MANRNLVAKIILRLQDEASRGIDTARRHVGGIGQEVDRVKQLMIGLFSFIAIKEGIENLVVLSDKFANLSARIKLATSSEQEFNTAQGELFNIAQRSRTALDTVVGLYAKVQIGVKNLGGTQKQSFDTTEAITRAFKISGASASESAGGIQQLTQSLASGLLRGEEFNSVMENGPRVAQALADGLGVPVAALRKMAEAGELTSERVINALLSQKDKLAAEYAILPQTVSGAWQQLENQFLKYIGKSQEAKDATAGIADSIGFVTDHLDAFINVAIKSGEAIAGIFVARKISGLFAFTQGLIVARTASGALGDAAVADAARASAAATSAATAIAVSAERAGAAAALAATTAGATIADVAVAAGVAAGDAALAAGATVTEAAEAASLAASAAARAAGASAAQAANAGALAAEAAAARIRVAAGLTTEAVSGLAAAGAGLSRLVGGPLGVAAIALYAFYEAIQKLTGAEEKAEAATKSHTAALALMNKEVQQLSGAEVDIDLAKTSAAISALEEKINGLQWSWKRLFNASVGAEVNKQIENLGGQLDVLKKKKEVLTE
jgi:tape measure domain-containing protein